MVTFQHGDRVNLADPSHWDPAALTKNLHPAVKDKLAFVAKARMEMPTPTVGTVINTSADGKLHYVRWDGRLTEEVHPIEHLAKANE